MMVLSFIIISARCTTFSNNPFTYRSYFANDCYTFINDLRRLLFKDVSCS